MSATFDQYVLNFRADLQSAARDCLSSLGLQIKEEGDDWLEAHLESLFSGDSTGGAIVEHLKTPSRTATAKKTRAKLEAERQRTDKVKSVNAKLALSPSSRSINASPARLLFQQNNNSPLQPRSMNAVTVPASPVRSKTSQPIKKQVPASKSSKTAKQDENSSSGQSNRLDHVRSPQRQPGPTVTSPVTRATTRQAALSPVQSPSRPTKSPLRHATSPSPRSPAAKQARSRPQSPSPLNQKAPAAPSAPQPGGTSKKPLTATAAHKDLSMILEGDSERNNTSRAKSPDRQTLRSPPANRPQSPRSGPQQPASPRSPVRRPVTHQPSIDSILAPSTQIAAAELPAAKPAAPVRAVRSSWLSKAIASGAVPVNPSSEASRKSVLPQARPTLYNDYAGLRKSLAAPAGAKRKSEDGPDVVEETARPVKVVKVEAPPTQSSSKPVFERQQSNPSAPIAVTAHPTPAPRPVSAQDVQTPSEILKVTKALEDIKERTQAKELAKQKAAAAAAAAAAGGQRTRETTNPGPSATTTTTSGFLRGLTKSLGLGGKTETPEEVAERLNRELEEDKRAEAEAQAELDRLMHEDRQGEEPDVVTPAPAKRSTTPVVSPPIHTKGEPHPDSDRTQEEEDEEEVVEALSLVVDEEADVEATPPPANTAQREEVGTAPTVAKQAQSQPIPPRLATPPRMSDFRMSTTPHGTPPRKPLQSQAPPLHDRAEKHERSTPAKQPKVTPAPVAEVSDQEDTADEEDEDVEDDGEADVGTATASTTQGKGTQSVNRVPHIKQAMASTRPTLPSSASSMNLAPLAPSSNGLLNQASTIAAKTLGVKPTTGPVKSVQLAQAAAKKEQDAAARKQTFKEQAEARRQEANRKKAEEERARAVEAERIRLQEIERGQKLRAELDRKKAEREEKMALAMKQQAERQQKEAAAAKAKAAEEEANRKRKMAPTLTKSTNANPAKRVAPGTTVSNGPTAQQKARETFRPTSSMKGAIASTATASTTTSGVAKLGPTSFRTAPSAPEPVQSTVRLVNANPAHLGPPSRPSGMAGTAHTHPHPQWSHVPTNAGNAAANAGPSNILQQQRVALQSQLDDKALEAQGEDIVLPDIASEYSDSDDSEKSTDFKRPEWAESPELRAALERQATRNPDELFGPIKPISMEELFKVKVNKFRPRSSSANWASGDGVTRKEEIEYAKRMGFKNLNPRAEGSSAGAHGL